MASTFLSAVFQAVSMRLRVPEVIVLAGYDKLPEAAVAFSRRNIFKRDHYTCQYCAVQPGAEELSIDHVIPRSHGGTSTWDNCVLACVESGRLKIIHQSIPQRLQCLRYAKHGGFLAQSCVCQDSQACPKEAVFTYSNPVCGDHLQWKKSSLDASVADGSYLSRAGAVQ